MTPAVQDRAASLGLLGFGVVLVFLAYLFTATEGHFVPQVVDLYLVCQYAQAVVDGHPFRYNAGDPPSTGATSLLHTLMLAFGNLVGFKGEGLIAFAILTGATFFILSVLLARRVGVILGTDREGLLAGALVALSGPLAWGFLYGSDTALFTLLSLWLLERLLLDWNRSLPGMIALAGVLMALTRPEGLVITFVIAAFWWFGPARAVQGPRRWFPFAPVAAGLGVLALNRSLTGLWLGTSVADKSLISNYGLAEALALSARYLVDVCRGVLLGFYPSESPVGFTRGWAPFYFPPLALLLALLVMVRSPGETRRPLFAWMLALGLSWILVTPNLFMGVHFNRYLMWGFPTFHILAAVGLGFLTRLLARGDANLEGSLFRAGAALFLVLGGLSTLAFASLYGTLAGGIYRRDVSAARWITANLPRGVAMANIATSVEFLTGHRNLNLHGVTSPEFFGTRMAEREANVFEALSRLPETVRPGYLISSESAQKNYSILDEIAAGPPLFRTSSFEDEIEIFRTKYDSFGKNRSIYLPTTLEAVRGLAKVDELNVTDAQDEKAHDYAFSSQAGDLRFSGAIRIANYDLPSGERVIDGGRAILGSESFVVRAQPGKDLVVVMRTAADTPVTILRADRAAVVGIEFPEAGFIAAGQRFEFRPRQGWEEYVFRVPRNLVGERTHLELRGRYASFYYWFFQ